MSRTVLVTGACGFTGSNMIEHLAEEWPDAEIVATDLPGSDRGEYYVEAPDEDDPQPVYYRDILDQFDVEFVPADLTEPEDVTDITAAADYDVVFHIASLFDYFAPREALYRVNVKGTRNLMSELAKQDSPRVIHWSTLGVLGDAGYENPKSEDDEYHPHNRYCESKVSQEQVVKTYEDRLDVTIVRPAPVYGPRHRYGVYNILSMAEEQEFVPQFDLFWPDRDSQFPCVHVDDVVGAATFLADESDAVGETYNVLSDTITQTEMSDFLSEELDVRQIWLPMPYQLYMLLAKAGYSLAVRAEKAARENDTRPPVDAPSLKYLTGNMWFSNEKLKSAGYELKYEDPRDGLRDYIDWCREHGYLEPPEQRDSRLDSARTSLKSRLSAVTAFTGR